MICGILDELHEQYEQMCKLTGKKTTRLAGSGNGIRRNPLMRKLAEEMFGMPMYVSEYEEEAGVWSGTLCGESINKITGNLECILSMRMKCTVTSR